MPRYRDPDTGIEVEAKSIDEALAKIEIMSFRAGPQAPAADRILKEDDAAARHLMAAKMGVTAPSADPGQINSVAQGGQDLYDTLNAPAGRMSRKMLAFMAPVMTGAAVGGPAGAAMGALPGALNAYLTETPGDVVAAQVGSLNPGSALAAKLGRNPTKIQQTLEFAKKPLMERLAARLPGAAGGAITGGTDAAAGTATKMLVDQPEAIEKPSEYTSTTIGGAALGALIGGAGGMAGAVQSKFRGIPKQYRDFMDDMKKRHQSTVEAAGSEARVRNTDILNERERFQAAEEAAKNAISETELQRKEVLQSIKERLPGIAKQAEIDGGTLPSHGTPSSPEQRQREIAELAKKVMSSRVSELEADTDDASKLAQKILEDFESGAKRRPYTGGPPPKQAPAEPTKSRIDRRIERAFQREAASGTPDKDARRFIEEAYPATKNMDADTFGTFKEQLRAGNAPDPSKMQGDDLTGLLEMSLNQHKFNAKQRLEAVSTPKQESKALRDAREGLATVESVLQDMDLARGLGQEIDSLKSSTTALTGAHGTTVAKLQKAKDAAEERVRLAVKAGNDSLKEAEERYGPLVNDFLWGSVAKALARGTTSGLASVTLKSVPTASVALRAISYGTAAGNVGNFVKRDIPHAVGLATQAAGATPVPAAIMEAQRQQRDMEERKRRARVREGASVAPPLTPEDLEEINRYRRR